MNDPSSHEFIRLRIVFLLCLTKMRLFRVFFLFIHVKHNLIRERMATRRNNYDNHALAKLIYQVQGGLKWPIHNEACQCAHTHRWNNRNIVQPTWYEENLAFFLAFPWNSQKKLIRLLLTLKCRRQCPGLRSEGK